MSRGKAKQAHDNETVAIKHLQSGLYVHQIVAGYVPQPYAKHGEKPAPYKRWQAKRFLNKWLTPEKAAEYQIEG